MLVRTKNLGKDCELIYLDANSTTPDMSSVLNNSATMMKHDFGNPSSNHALGYFAKKQLDSAREAAGQAIGCRSDEITFTSCATEAIQTAILSALLNYKSNKNDTGNRKVLLYGSTEHKAIPKTLEYWRDNLEINADIVAIPVDSRGVINTSFIREYINNAILVCTMYVNNETGVIQDIDAIQQCFTDTGSDAFWLVDCVQALGKCDIDLSKLRIDYAPFSGHKLYAPKGVGMLYVRNSAPFKPLLVGGGQESGLRSGTENTAGITAFGSILSMLNERKTRVFKSKNTLQMFRTTLLTALDEAFKGIVYNTPLDISIPTTINFSVPDINTQKLINMFNAVGILISAGSACNSIEKSSFVLEAMGLEQWRCENSIRLSFGLLASHEEIEEASRRIRKVGELLQSDKFISTNIHAEPLEAQLPIEIPTPLTWETLFKKNNSNNILVDVRSEIEWRLCKRSSIYNFPCPIKSIPIELLQNLLEMGVDNSKNYIFVCHAGSRSLAATIMANRYGYCATYIEDGWQCLDTR